jgi:hypothetical protein
MSGYLPSVRRRQRREVDGGSMTTGKTPGMEAVPLWHCEAADRSMSAAPPQIL